MTENGLPFNDTTAVNPRSLLAHMVFVYKLWLKVLELYKSLLKPDLVKKLTNVTILEEHFGGLVHSVLEPYK